MLVFKLAALVELILVILEFSGFVHLRGLPLGGGPIQQLGIVFTSAYVVAEFIDLFRQPQRQPRPWSYRSPNEVLATDRARPRDPRITPVPLHARH